jgi:hypothetical protein
MVLSLNEELDLETLWPLVKALLVESRLLLLLLLLNIVTDGRMDGWMDGWMCGWLMMNRCRILEQGQGPIYV